MDVMSQSVTHCSVSNNSRECESVILFIQFRSTLIGLGAVASEKGGRGANAPPLFKVCDVAANRVPKKYKERSE